ncbi:MAG: alpha/beta fold hydrolase [Candidatus Eiseniibacteriota bacterium]
MPPTAAACVRRATIPLALVLLCAFASPAHAAESDFVVHDFRFNSGEMMPELRLHVLTLGRLTTRADGHTNAVLILHGTGGTGRQFLSPQFAGELYGAGAPLDSTKFFIILPDGIGHGRSSKPSDGLHMKIPHYDYADMVEAHFRLLTEHLGIKHLRLVMGTSMGGMQTFVWAEAHPDFMDALMPLACLPTAIVGRNRLWRSMIVDAIEHDPGWNGGEYSIEPAAGMRTAVDLLMIAGSAPILMQNTLASRDSVDRWLAAQLTARMASTDANDLIYQIESSRHYDPSAALEKISAPLVHVNSGDDFINPPELAIAEKLIARVKGGKFVMIPASAETHGHGTHTWAALWKQHLAALLAATN